MNPENRPPQATFLTTIPSYIHGESMRSCDGVNDDLLTAGMGKDRLAFGTAPAMMDPKNPTADELRRLAIYTNYRALIDTSVGGGYGVLYGPDVNSAGTSAANSAGRIRGVEYLAFAADRAGGQNVTLMVQIPADFDWENPCIVTAPSSGSRGIYGAIGTAGEWALKRRCAVAYTDKGTGIGAHDLSNDTVNLVDGRREKAGVAGTASHFTAKLGNDEYGIEGLQNRFAFKHAHSQQNPERDWGKNVLHAVEYAFYLLNQQFGQKDENGVLVKPTITPENTLVIASSVSNGGAASLRAAELDKGWLIKGVAVAEPNVTPKPSTAFVIQQGTQAPFAEHSRSLFDYITLVNVYQACASVAVQNTGAPANTAGSPARCRSLGDKGLLVADTLAAQAAEAQAQINQYGILREQNSVQPGYWTLYVPQSITVTFSQAYGRLSVNDPLCGYSFGATIPAGTPTAADPATTMALFGIGNGIPPNAGISLINDRSTGGPLEERLSFSQSTARQDQNLDGALRLRELATGVDSQTRQPLTGRMQEVHHTIERSIAEIRASGELHGIPTVIVHGRSDGVIAPNHTSRPYYALALTCAGDKAANNIRYYEITNAHHLDTLNGLEGFNARFVPLHHYFLQALDLMWEHLKKGKALPPSQVVRTTPRRDLTPPGAPLVGINAANAAVITPPISATPPDEDCITFDGKVLHIPD